MLSDFSDLMSYIAVFIFVIALIGVGAWLLKSFMSDGGASMGGLLRRGERRLGVVEAASVDGRRKLVLIRRDSTEHLIMTGGPVDVLIETGIQGVRPADRLDQHRDERGVTFARGDQQRGSFEDD